jgi:hypothetical protein
VGETVKSLGQLEQDVQQGDCSLFRYCGEIAMMFRVRPHEVAVMELRHSMLHFVYPPELRKTGLIPLISSAQAAKTATSRRAEIFNNFSMIRHSSVFETIKVSGESGQAIQRLMSAPILSPEGDVLGVIQVSRKGATPMDAGAEFEVSDLQTLRDVANSFGRVARPLLDRSVETPKVEAAPGQVLTK